jgi:hypothetical protein
MKPNAAQPRRREWFGAFAEDTRRSTEWRGAMSYITVASLAALSKHVRIEKSLTFLTDLPAVEQGELVDTIERGRLPSDHAYQAFCQDAARRLHTTVREIAGECTLSCLPRPCSAPAAHVSGMPHRGAVLGSGRNTQPAVGDGGRRERGGS